ncbi:hypothetical protein J2Y69_001425 [Microbacterium resistens]|uniref:Secreted protein n=1 Tax=Microbacterium resistens TaxID=156977 RepID=A0ABU1SBA3_9MICO|nr:hypothetical protein [Microbacterium resistens]MDR6866826.1 hypothetical protein [Microbacterium resistens]
MSKEFEGGPVVEGSGAVGLPRRTIVKGAAWSLPVIAAAAAVPMASASVTPTDCNGCFSWDPTAQNIGSPPANTWLTAPIDNVDTPRTYGTALVAYYSLKYNCVVPDDVRYVSYLVNYDSHIQAAPGTTVSTSDGGSVQPVYNPAGVVNIPGAGGSGAGIVYGPNSGVTPVSNVSALGYAVIYAGNVGWSAPATDLTSGPSLSHHITGTTFTANVQFTTVYMDGTVSTSSCTADVTLMMASPYPGTSFSPTDWQYWYAGSLTGIVA